MSHENKALPKAIVPGAFAVRDDSPEEQARHTEWAVKATLAALDDPNRPEGEEFNIPYFVDAQLAAVKFASTEETIHKMKDSGFLPYYENEKGEVLFDFDDLAETFAEMGIRVIDGD